jgi:uncharacterized RDD family membrane protein YckC
MTQPQVAQTMPLPAAPGGDLLATYGSRVAASLLDGVIGAAVLIIGALAHVQALSIIGLLVWLAYPYVTMLRSGPTKGQTIGKQIVGIRVVPQSAVPLSLGTVLVRELIGKQLLSLLTLGLYGLLDYLWPAWDAKNQALHDKVASTLVVKADTDRSLISSIGMPVVFLAPAPAATAPPPPPPPAVPPGL